jgi:hypothetical protein
MPTTPLERLKNPLRKLRVILGEFGSPMSQEVFAAQTGLSANAGLSVNTLRSIENQRLPLSENILTIIKARWLAGWNTRDQEWHFLDTKKLYSKELAAKVKSPSPADQRLMKQKLHERLDEILKATPPEALAGRIMLLSRDLVKHAKETGLAVDLRSTEPEWFLRPDLAADEMRLIAKYPSGKSEKTGPKPDRNGKAVRNPRRKSTA